METGQSNINNAASVANYLGLYLGQDQGVRLGDSTVVSTKAHRRMPEKKIKGQVEILINSDAGQTYLNYVDPDQIVHIDVHHMPGNMDVKKVALAIYWAINEYVIEEDPQLQYVDDVRFKAVAAYAEKIHITTNLGQGWLFDVMQNEMEPYIEGEEGQDHVHILARLNRQNYALIYIIASAVEDIIQQSGIQLAEVRNITHGKEKKILDDFGNYIKLPWKKFKGKDAMLMAPDENVNQLVLKLAEKFGGVEDIEEWMQMYSTNIFKRKGADFQKKMGRHRPLCQTTGRVGLMQKTPLEEY